MIGIVALAQPTGVLPATWATALGAGPPPASSPDIAGPTATIPLPLRAPVATPTATTAAPTDAAQTTTAVAPPSVRPTAAAARPTTPRPIRASTRPAAPKPAVPKPAAVAPVNGGQTTQVVALTNQARAEAGCAALSTDPRLTAAAQGHSADMAAHDYFAHDSRDGRTFADRIEAAGYPSPGGENIAQGQQDAQEVVTAWLNSPGHRRNIENCSFTTIGVGLAGGDEYWTQDFGR